MSPTKEELAEEAKVAQLKELAEEHEVDLDGVTLKDDIVEKIVSSGKVTKADISAKLGEDEVEAEGEEGELIQGYPPIFNQKPILRQTHWVRLGSGRRVPREVRGHVARIDVAPIWNRGGREYQPDETEFEVVTRDITQQRVTAKRSDFEEIFFDNRPSV